MAKEIGLKIKITSDGSEKVISSITQLEDELKVLQNTLKTAEFGSRQFKEAAQNIQILKSRLEDVDKTTEGIGVEKRLRAIGDTTNLLSGSFQALSGVVGTLSSDEETLKAVQDAEAKSLNVLNIALGVRAVNEGILESKIFRRELAEKALNITSKAYIATAKGVSAALGLVGIEAGVASAGVRALTSAFAALGLPLLIIGITTLVEKFSEVNAEAPKIKTAKEAYDDFNKSLEKTNELQDARIGYIKSIGENEAALQTDLQKNQDEYNKRLQKQSDLFRDLEIVQQDIFIAEKDRDKDRTARLKIREKEIKDNLDANLIATIKLETAVKNSEKAITDFQKQEEDKRNAKSKENRDKREQFAIQEIQKRLELQKLYLAQLQGFANQEIEVQAEVLDRVKELIDKQQALIDERNQFAKKESEKLTEDINRLFFDIIPTAEDAKLLEDFYIKIFDRIGLNFERLPKDVKITFDDLIKLYNELGEELKNPLGADFTPITAESVKLTDEARQGLLNYFNTIQRFTTSLAGKENQDLITKFVGKDTKTKLEEANVFLKKLVDEGVKQLSDETLLAGEAEQNLTKFVKENLGLTEKRGARTKTAIAEQTAYNERIQTFTKLLVDLAKKEGDVVIESNKVRDSLGQLKLEAARNENALTRLNTFTTLFGKDLIDLDKKLTDTEIENFGKKLTDAFSTSQEAFTGFINNVINNTDGLRDKLLRVISPQDFVKIVQDASLGLENLTFKSAEEIEGLINIIKELEISFGEAITSGEVDGEKLGVGYKTFSDILDKLNKKLKETNDNTKALKKSFQETFSESDFKKIADIILSSFTTISSQLSNIVQQQNSLLLEQLQYQQEQALSIIGEANTESEEENKRILEERAKVEKEYSKKKFDAEKKARVSELQFSLANAIAQGAQAIINTYATLPTAAAIPFSLVLAGLTAAQVAVINDQLQFTQSKAYFGRTGGLVEGSSHDTYGGGVPTMLEGGEFILNREAVRAYGDTISSINTATGGKPMSIDDSRIVQAIAKQNLSTKSPLKAYVLYNDIQDTTKLNKKIEQLARL
jgi:hypothetical protein